MPIDAWIDGDPESIRAAGRWLRAELSKSVYDRVTEVKHLSAGSESYWQADSGIAFRGKAANGGRSADVLARDADRAGQSFQVYADDLHTALAGMARARQIAAAGGLVVTDTQILEPGPEPAIPTGTVTAAARQAYTSTAQAHAQRAAAYQQASAEASLARGVLDRAKSTFRAALSDLWGKRYFNTADFVNGVVGELAHLHTSILRKEAGRIRDESALARERYLKAPGGSLEAKLYTEMEFSKANLATDLEGRAAAVGRRIGSKIPILGLGITAAGIGYDIANGKPPGKAIISGGGGAVVAVIVGGVVGGPIGAAAAGLLAGTFVGVGLDAAYDHLPQGVKNKIEGGVKAVGHAAKKVWDSIF